MTLRFVVAFVVAVAAFAVMPDGPWYRQIGAALLVLLSDRIRCNRG